MIRSKIAETFKSFSVGTLVMRDSKTNRINMLYFTCIRASPVMYSLWECKCTDAYFVLLRLQESLAP